MAGDVERRGWFERYVRDGWPAFLLIFLLVPVLGWLGIPVLYGLLGLGGYLFLRGGQGKHAAAEVMKTAGRWLAVGVGLCFALLLLSELASVASLCAGGT